MPLSGKEVLKRLKKAGFKEARINGSHHVLVKDIIIVSVPVHGSKDLKFGLLKKIEKDTGVKLS